MSEVTLQVHHRAAFGRKWTKLKELTEIFLNANCRNWPCQS